MLINQKALIPSRDLLGRRRLAVPEDRYHPRSRVASSLVILQIRFSVITQGAESQSSDFADALVLCLLLLELALSVRVNACYRRWGQRNNRWRGWRKIEWKTIQI